MNPLYTARAHIVGGRSGRAETSDGKLSVELAPPSEMGGSGRGTNPEQLFAAGYGACYLSALGLVARHEKVNLGEHSADTEVSLVRPPQGEGYDLVVTLRLNLPAVDRTVAEGLMQKAHTVCPYSRATRGNIEVNLVLA